MKVKPEIRLKSSQSCSKPVVSTLTLTNSVSSLTYTAFPGASSASREMKHGNPTATLLTDSAAG